MSILEWWTLLHKLFDCTEWDVNPSGIHSIKWLGHIPIAPANMTEIMVSPKTLDIQLVTAGEKNASRWNAILPKFVKKAATDLHRFDFDGLRHKHGGSVFLGMEFAAIAVTVWLNWTRSQSFKTSLDQMTRSHCNSPGKYAGIMISPKTLDIQLVTAGEKILGVNGTPSRKSLSKWLLQTCITLIWTGPPWALRALKPKSKKPAWYGSTIPLDQFCDCPG